MNCQKQNGHNTYMRLGDGLQLSHSAIYKALAVEKVREEADDLKDDDEKLMVEYEQELYLNVDEGVDDRAGEHDPDVVLGIASDHGVLPNHELEVLN